jgi:hypothetical protein
MPSRPVSTSRHIVQARLHRERNRDLEIAAATAAEDRGDSPCRLPHRNPRHIALRYSASREAPLRGLTLENTFHPSHMIGCMVGAAVGFFLGFFLGFPLLFLIGKKFFLLIHVLALGGASLGNLIGKSVMRSK